LETDSSATSRMARSSEAVINNI